MNVKRINPMDDCLDKVVTKEIIFSQPATHEWILNLNKLGRLEYFQHFPRPFYRVTNPGYFIIKGVEGRDRCQVVFVNYSKDLEVELIHGLDGLQSYGMSAL